MSREGAGLAGLPICRGGVTVERISRRLVAEREERPGPGTRVLGMEGN